MSNPNPRRLDRAWRAVAYRRQGDLRDGENLRQVTMGKGIHFDQVATEWRENERVSWRYRFDADSVPRGALDDHVRIGNWVEKYLRFYSARATASQPVGS